MNGDFMTQTEVLSFLGMNQKTFKSHAQRIGIKGEKNGRCTLYKRSDIERMNKMYEQRVPFLINMLEKLTGCKVILKPINTK